MDPLGLPVAPSEWVAGFVGLVWGPRKLEKMRTLGDLTIDVVSYVVSIVLFPFFGRFCA